MEVNYDVYRYLSVCLSVSSYLGISFNINLSQGNGGSLWTDGGEVHLNGLITEIELRTGSEVDSIRTKYGEVWSNDHGGGGGSSHAFSLNAGAKIVIVQGRSGSRCVPSASRETPAEYILSECDNSQTLGNNPFKIQLRENVWKVVK